MTRVLATVAAVVLLDGVSVVARDSTDEPVGDGVYDICYVNAGNREQIAALLGTVVAACLTSGFDSVEIDNLDSYSRSGGALTIKDNIDLAARYARVARPRAGYGDLVFDIEYDAAFLAAACDDVPSAVLRDLGPSAPGSPDYVFETC